MHRVEVGVGTVVGLHPVGCDRSDIPRTHYELAEIIDTVIWSKMRGFVSCNDAMDSKRTEVGRCGVRYVVDLDSPT